MLDEGVIVEIVRPGTGDPVPEGEVGELVVTTLNPAYPLIRFGTGDLSAILPGTCPTGRTAPRIKGWMGRADQTTKVRGMFVHAAQVADIARRFPQVHKARLVISGEMANDQMCLKVEASEADDALARLDRDGRARRDQAARRRAAGAAGQPAQRRQGDRGRAQLPVTRVVPVGGWLQLQQRVFPGDRLSNFRDFLLSHGGYHVVGPLNPDWRSP